MESATSTLAHMSSGTYIGNQMRCTRQSMELVSSVVGFDIIELWTADSEQKLACTYVHATKAMLQHRPNIIVGHYPNHKKVHRVSPKLCEMARQAKGRYYWKVKNREDERLEADALESNIHTEMATYLDTNGAHIYIVGFLLEKLPYKAKWVKFIAGLSYAIYVAAFDLDDEEDEGDDADPGVDYSLSNKRYIPRAGSGMNLGQDAGGAADRNPYGLLGLEIEKDYYIENLQIIQGRGRGGSDTVLRETLQHGPSYDLDNHDHDVSPHPVYPALTTVVSQLSSSETDNTNENGGIAVESVESEHTQESGGRMTERSIGKSEGSVDGCGGGNQTCTSGGDMSGSEEHINNAELDIVSFGERAAASSTISYVGSVDAPNGPDSSVLTAAEHMHVQTGSQVQAYDVAEDAANSGATSMNAIGAETEKVSAGTGVEMLLAYSHVAPTWEPVDPFSFPVAALPVTVAAPDNLLMEHFTDIQYIADGSNANIFLARLNDEKVIIKMIKEEIQGSGVAMHEFNVEHGLLSRISHPNIIKLVGAGIVPRRFIVLEWLGGGTLSTILSHNQFKSGLAQKLFRRPSFTYTNLLSRAKDVADALNFLNTTCHPGATIIHRDLKPDNIGFTTDGQVKLFDFGLCTLVKARTNAEDTYQMTGNTGSLRYMAPEVALKQPYNEKADVYSFGIMVWQMARDRVPFKGMSREEFMTRVVQRGERPKLDKSWPSAFSNMLESCWNADHMRRPSFQELSDLLGKLQTSKTSLQVTVPPMSPTSPAARVPASALKQNAPSCSHGRQ